MEVEVESNSNVSFYNDGRLILLTHYISMIVGTVKGMFDKQNISVFENVGDVCGVCLCTDTTLLHSSRRILCHYSTSCAPHEYNVDIKREQGDRDRTGVGAPLFSHGHRL